MHYPYPLIRLLIFAKAPVLGRAKTRMQPALSMQQCALLQQQLIEHTVQMAVDSALCPVELWVTDAESDFLIRCARQFNIPLKMQTGDDLGQRMSRAFDTTLAETESTIIIGCDCPELSKTHLQRLMQELAVKDNTVALIPARDGGYVAIGMHVRAPQLFNGISWGTEHVLQQTRNKARRQGLKLIELEPLTDIDRPQDLLLLEQFADSEKWKRIICR